MILCPFKELRRYAAVIPGLEEAIETIEKLPNRETATYPLSCGKVMVSSGSSKPLEGALLEAHAKFLDIQYILEGSEVMGWAPTDSLDVATPYNPEKDCSMHAGDCQFFHIPAGYCYIVFPEDAHAPAVHLGDKVCSERKMIIKLKV